jgi:cytochrome o ubiquinol oxidase subunit 3
MNEHILPAQNSTSNLGFWIYLMTDCVLFASLFAAYAVLHDNTFGGPVGRDLFSLPSVLAETLLLLTSSFTCGLGILAARSFNKNLVLIWFGVTFVLGASFLGLELSEFSKLIHDGNGPSRNAFLSAFFTLVGTHGLHITAGLLWMIVLLQKIWRRGVSTMDVKRLTLLSLFWHFLDIIWIFIFTIVYLLGAV